MKDLTNINKAVLEIGQLIASNNTICNLLYIDEPDALTRGDGEYSFNQLVKDKYITIYPPVETAIKDAERNTFLVILLDGVSLNYTDNNIRSSINIYITTDKDHILLDENKNRLLELGNELIKTLNGYKLSSAGEIVISSMMHVMINEFRAGYRISLSLTDQTTRKAEI